MGNLHLVTGYAGQAHITAADHGSLNAAIIGNGMYVLNRGNLLAASAVTNNQIRILDGDIMLQGRHVRLPENTYVDLTIENGEQGMLRNDLIVARYTKNNTSGVEECSLVVIKGASSASNPVDPEYTTGDLLGNQDSQTDFPLYRVPLNELAVGEPVPLFTVVDATLGSLNARSIRTSTVIDTGWVGTEVPYKKTMMIAGVKEDSIVEISLSSSANAEQVKAYNELGLQDGGQTDGAITLRCFGAINEVDIPVNVVVRRD